METALVSIIIPVFNQLPKYLSEAIESAIAQEYENIEIIISDNHSTNNTYEIIQKYAQSSNKIKVVKPEVHLPIIEHFTFAAQFAKGEFISFLSSDDLIYSNCIEQIVRPMINDPEIALSYCENDIIDANGNVQYKIRGMKLSTGIYSANFGARRIYGKSEYWIIGGICKTEHFKKIGFPHDLMAADWVLGIKLLKFGKIHYINKPLSAIRIYARTGNASEEYTNRYAKHYKQVLEKHNYVVEDKELLHRIDISKNKAKLFRNIEILSVAVTLIREYHKQKLDLSTLSEVMSFYSKSQKTINFVLLHRLYRYKIVIPLTYIVGLTNRIKKIIYL